MQPHNYMHWYWQKNQINETAFYNRTTNTLVDFNIITYQINNCRKYIAWNANDTQTI